MMAPMPSAVSDHGPSVFFSRWAASSESEISLSMDFLAKNWLGSSVAPVDVMTCRPGAALLPPRPLRSSRY
jgi:hypothetical protein